LDESRFIDAELDTGTKLDAMEVASAELIGDADFGGAELTGGSARRAQRRGVDVGDAEFGGNTGFSARAEFAGGAQRAGGVWP
jgi:uncharacterized protein YjbI with pentapeptide repeats